ncbi:transposase [Enterobacter cloacae complex sp. 339J8]|uniref:transposase n=1 Tax=Enterobacter cloacae complex sp. 339J8 TaxID=3395869 RepID=UPI003CED866B
MLFVNHERPVTAGSICISALTQGVRGKGGCRKTQREHRSSAREPWLLFSNAEGLEPHEIMTLYSRRMQIEQNFRDDKSPRFGFGSG